MPILSSFISGFQKRDLVVPSSIINAKNRISKKDVIIFTCFFFTIAQPNMKIVLLKVGMCVVFMQFYNTNSVFFG